MGTLTHDRATDQAGAGLSPSASCLRRRLTDWNHKPEASL